MYSNPVSESSGSYRKWKTQENRLGPRMEMKVSVKDPTIDFSPSFLAPKEFSLVVQWGKDSISLCRTFCVPIDFSDFLFLHLPWMDHRMFTSKEGIKIVLIW